MTTARKRGGQLLSTPAFIAKARAIHGDTYDYSGADYKGSLEPLAIGCKVHGQFFQKPNNHLHGKAGCPSCAEGRRISAISTLDTDSFIARSIELNGDRYGYDKTEYKGPLIKLTMTCPVHGDFEQTPNNHLYGKAGCYRCGRDSSGAATRMTPEDFIARATAVHGETYDYSRLSYQNAMTTVNIVCRKHGVFKQWPLGHLQGAGCTECHFEARRLDRSAFVRRSREIFDREYDYSLIPGGWVPTRNRVQIICPHHGVFSTVAGEHLRGSGCLGCVESQPEKAIRELLSEAGIDFEAQWGHPTLRHKGPLRFDFMLPAAKTLIEYDGLFHFQVVQWPGQTREEAVDRFEQGQLRDEIKDRWASDNGWRLIRLSGSHAIEERLIELGILPNPIDCGKAA